MQFISLDEFGQGLERFLNYKSVYKDLKTSDLKNYFKNIFILQSMVLTSIQINNTLLSTIKAKVESKKEFLSLLKMP